ncbi:hypothetical protein PHSY_001616 [Pseudozyma hubeiensis SY62]|uniref:Uncharacterized protein n=1 Tax=Pseudozyma hubeiensis (strain SY62) TaxID=1305764 RepID=R9NZC0_PSEHS|nr:hypothetical protein PHSY_001616 [Pseudozyma hubeiensis SY62]GAC94047.1 hypothetical protein PHSY_001616 [Pseudozyma hubeiensis SY62]
MIGFVTPVILLIRCTRVRMLIIRRLTPVDQAYPFHTVTQREDGKTYKRPLRLDFSVMCIFDDLSSMQTAVKPVVIEYEVRICEKEEYINVDASSEKSPMETLVGPPAYEARPRSVVTINTAARVKTNFFSRVFSRNHKKSPRSAKELPSYREAELVQAWAKVGIDINDRKQGPRPKCTPQELLQAMDGLFGTRSVLKAA